MHSLAVHAMVRSWSTSYRPPSAVSAIFGNSSSSSPSRNCLAHETRLSLAAWTARRPVRSSRRTTPSANTSVFSLNTPCVVYSGGTYPNVPSKTVTWRCVRFAGSHRA
uniref:Uncharacterized protein n=1 Tax=Arundo donax TaxID=35708 RepID=A0A0A9HGN4_ARUDO